MNMNTLIDILATISNVRFMKWMIENQMKWKKRTKIASKAERVYSGACSSEACLLLYILCIQYCSRFCSLVLLPWWQPPSPPLPPPPPWNQERMQIVRGNSILSPIMQLAVPLVAFAACDAAAAAVSTRVFAGWLASWLIAIIAIFIYIEHFYSWSFAFNEMLSLFFIRYGWNDEIVNENGYFPIRLIVERTHTHTRAHTLTFSRWHHKNIVLCKCIWIEFFFVVVLRQSYNDDFTIRANKMRIEGRRGCSVEE